MIGKKIGRIAAALALAAGISGVARADAPAVPTPGQQLAWTLHLLEQARYGEASNAAVQLVTMEPNAAVSFETRGTLALSIGSLSQAERDFQTAARRAPQDAAAQYGLGLCALFGKRFAEADRDFAAAQVCPGLTAEQAADVTTANAYIAFLQGQAVTLPANDAATPDPMRQELEALADLRSDPAAGTAQMTQFLTTPSGAPRVREDDGIKALFDLDQPLEPSVIEPSVQQTDAVRLADGIALADREQGPLKTITGVYVIDAQIPASSPVAVVSFSVDGHAAAMLNGAPFVFRWDTAEYVNGRHSVTVETSDAAGNVLSTHTRLMRVDNAVPKVTDDGLGDLTADDAAQAEQRLWSLLRLRPARVAAEWALADHLAAQGNTTDADAHRLVAAALDPNYKDSRRYARLVLGQDTGVESASEGAFKVASTQAVGLWRGDSSVREVALTFDDGPNPQKTPALLDALQKADCPATFFVVGARAEENPDLIRRMAAMGDDVENHSYTHPNMDQVEPITAEEEMLRNCVIVRALTGRAPRFFRPPGGNGGAAVQALAQKYGLTETFWSLDAINAEFGGSPAGVVSAVVNHIHPGSIVLMHDAPDATIAAIPALVAGLRAKGYTLVTLSHMTLGQATGAPKGASGRE